MRRNNVAIWQATLCVLCVLLGSGHVSAEGVHHYVFFNRDRERIADTAFLKTKAFEGAQLKYVWRELEPEKDQYNFDDIEHDLAFLQSKGKKLFIQIQDASFDINIRPFPRYLLKDPEYHGGADKQIGEGNVPCGWIERRWDPAVRERFHRPLLALGREFDGRIEGINLPETAIDLASTERLWPKGLTREVYCEAILTNMMVLKRAFPRSMTVQYANFMPGDRPYLERVLVSRGATLGLITSFGVHRSRIIRSK